jgi:hypothetical protein
MPERCAARCRSTFLNRRLTVFASSVRSLQPMPRASEMLVVGDHGLAAAMAREMHP